jgi:WD domain, G-beta repeat
LTGAGGFGKTTLATMVRVDPRIAKEFPAGSVQVIIGKGVRGVELAEKINDLVGMLGEQRRSYTDPESAGAHLMGLLDAGRRLRWVAARLARAGPAAVDLDLDLARQTTPRSASLGRAFARTAHLLTPIEPDTSLLDVLASRLREDPAWREEADRWHRALDGPRLASNWPLPDLPDEALRRILSGHTAAVLSVAIAPDGTWIATASDDTTVRIWDAATTTVQTTLTGHTGPVRSVAIAPDGTRLATASDDQTVRVWDTATITLQATLTGHTSRVRSAMIAPDGTWLATASDDHTVLLRDTATSKQRATLTGHTGPVRSVAIARTAPGSPPPATTRR